MHKLTELIDNILTKFLIFLMALIVLVVSWQVFTRFIMQDPSSYTEELARFLLIWIGLLGASYALRTKAHLGIDVITLKLDDSKKQIIEIVVNLLIILFAFFIMIIGGFYLVQLAFTLNQISAALGIKMGYVYLVIPISGLLILYYSVYNIVTSFLKMVNKEN